MNVEVQRISAKSHLKLLINLKYINQNVKKQEVEWHEKTDAGKDKTDKK